MSTARRYTNFFPPARWGRGGGARPVLGADGAGGASRALPEPSCTHPHPCHSSIEGERSAPQTEREEGPQEVYASSRERSTPSDLYRAALIALAATAATLIHPTLALAQAINLDLGTGGGLTDRVVQLVALLTVLSLAPSIVMMTTSFVRITVVLSLLRQALGLQQSPPNSVLVSLALFLTAIVMGPTFTASYNAGIRPLLNHTMELPAAFQASAQPVKTFMLGQVDRDDLGLFIRLSRIPKPKTAQDTPLTVVTPAFMISELKRAFQIGFLLFVPFLVIDLVVASVLMSMGMMMLPPATVSLPFKLIFFVLVNGWQLVCGSLVESFRHAPGG